MKSFLLKFLLLPVLLSLPLSAMAADNPKVILILDSSGSMWGQIEGKAKITIAKESVTQIIDTMPTDFHTGLIAYGHRRKGDCNDIELIVPPGPHDPAGLKAKINALNSLGKTPLSASVQLAAQTLRSTEEAASVILLTDGLETCEADPCQVAADLALSGVDFTVHVIGFDLSQGDLGRLRCMADKTGGLFLAANDAGALQSALQKTIDKVKESPVPVVEAPGTATLKAPAQVVVGATFEVNWQGPGSLNDYICLTTTDREDKHCLDHAYAEKGNPVKLAARCDPGTYELRYVHAHSDTVIGQTKVTVVPAQVELQVPAEVDAASPIEVSWKGPGYETDYIAVSSPEQQEHSYLSYTYASEGSPLRVQAPSAPGNYEIRYILGNGNKVLGRKGLKVNPVTAAIEIPQAADAAATFSVKWQGPGNDTDFISIARAEDEGGVYAAYDYTRSGNPLKLTAPSTPGAYEVRYVLGQDNVILARKPIEVKGVGAQVTPPAEANIAAEFEVSWQGPGNDTDFISIAHAGDEGGVYATYDYTRSGNPLKLTAPSAPGTYEVRYVLGQGNVILARKPIEVKAVGAQVTPPAAANMAAEFEVSWQGPGNDSDFISIARAEDEGGAYATYDYTRSGNPLKLKAPSEPGTYEVRYVLGQGNVILARKPIEIKAVEAKVQAPPSAARASVIQVSWQGPNADSDYISIAPPADDDGSYLQYQYTSAGNPVEIKTPDEPGTYEIRYVLGQGNKVIARTSLQVE